MNTSFQSCSCFLFCDRWLNFHLLFPILWLNKVLYIFLYYYLAFFSWVNMISVNNNSFASWFNMDHFTFEEREGFFSLTRTTFLNKNGKVGYYFLVLDFKGQVFSLPPLSSMWTMDFSYRFFFFLSWQVIGLINSLFLYWDDHVIFLLIPGANKVYVPSPAYHL